MNPIQLPAERGVNGPATAGPLMIVGSPRSGTTFLTRTINRFLNIHVARDAGLFLRFHRDLRWYGDLAEPIHMRRLIAAMYKDSLFQTRFLQRGLRLTEPELYDRLPELNYGALVRTVFRETARSHGKEFWGNKKPSYALHLSETEAVFPGAKIVHIVRDGRDVVLSMRRASHLLVEKNWYFAASDWNDHVLLARRAGESLGAERYLEIKYENLLANPVEVFHTLLEFAGAGPDLRGQLEKVRVGITAKIRADNHGKWRTQMPDHAIRTVERVAGDLLNDLGYETKFPAVRGKRFNRAQIGMFYVDRAIRNIFMRDSKKLVRSHLNELVTAGRARLGARWGGKTASVVAANRVRRRER